MTRDTTTGDAPLPGSTDRTHSGIDDTPAATSSSSSSTSAAATTHPVKEEDAQENLHQDLEQGDDETKPKQQQKKHSSSSAKQQNRVTTRGSNGGGAIDEPPNVWSLFAAHRQDDNQNENLDDHKKEENQRQQQRRERRDDDTRSSFLRKLVHCTPQHVATLHVPPSSSSSSSVSGGVGGASLPSSSSSPTTVPPLLFRQEYLIQALSDGGGKIAFWNLSNINKRMGRQKQKQQDEQRHDGDDDDRNDNEDSAADGDNPSCCSSTFRVTTTLAPDFVLDTGANSPLVELVLYDDNDDDDDEEDTAALVVGPAAEAKQQQEHQQQEQQLRPHILALSTLGRVFLISVVEQRTTQQQQELESSSSSSNNAPPPTTTSDGNNNRTTTETSSSLSTTAAPSASATASARASPASSTTFCASAKVLYSWNTERAGATCLATTTAAAAAACGTSSSSSSSPSSPRGGDDNIMDDSSSPAASRRGDGVQHQRQVLIGYQSGHLEAWDIINATHATSAHNNKDNDDDKTEAMTSTSLRAEKRWTGVFDHYFPIHSLMRVPVSSRCQRAQDSSEYLALTLHPPSGVRISTPRLMEVINLTTIEKAVKVQRSSAADDNQADVMAVVSLEDHWVLPEPGKEMRDPATFLRGSGMHASSRKQKKASSSGLPRTVHWIPSDATNRLCSLGTTSAVASGDHDDGTTGSFAVALADGTVGIMNAKLVQQKSSSDDNDDTDDSNGHVHHLDWGIVKPVDQLLFSYPCIGLGKVDLLSTPHAVCALRGGTIYLIPLADTTGNDDINPPPPLKVLAYPDDIDTDANAVQHLQSFAAGNVRVSFSSKEGQNASPATSTRMPLLFYSWPGGIIDVYTCHLLRSDAQVERVALDNLMTNGSVEALKSLLVSLTDEDVADEDILKAFGPSCGTLSARKEIECFHGKTLTVDDITSDKLRAFRSILLRFADQVLSTSSERWEPL